MTAVFVVIVLISIALLYRSAKSELAPQEDTSFVLAQSTYAPDATLQRKLQYGAEAFKILKTQKGVRQVFQFETPGPLVHRPAAHPDQRNARARPRSKAAAQQSLNAIAGAKIAVFQLPAAAGRLRISGAIRHQDHRAAAALERGVAGISRCGATRAAPSCSSTPISNTICRSR